MTLTGQKRTDRFDFSLDDVVLLKQDLEKEDADEQVVCDDVAVETVLLGFFVFPVKRELRNVARRPPGEIGCFTFFKSLYIFNAFDFTLLLLLLLGLSTAIRIGLG